MKNSDAKTYIAIDLKSFYASVECKERGRDPLTTNLVVADKKRTNKGICLAVTPSLKELGVGSRPRLFEVIKKVSELNKTRAMDASIVSFTNFSDDINELKENKMLGIDYIVAPPQMALYIDYSKRIYEVYLKFFSEEDIHVYSIDEVFIDATSYLKLYKMSAHDLTRKVIEEVLNTTGITATAGIGTNLYLSKVAMDIVAKKLPPDKDGVRIAQIDEMSYRKLLWNHVPITDFWRIGSGYARSLAQNDMYTIGDVARCSIGNSNEYKNEKLLYDLFGINAELLIDHAWGYEPVNIKDIKAYKPAAKSLCTGQVLHEPYTYEKTRLIIKEMADLLALDLVNKTYLTNKIVLYISYDNSNFTNNKYAQDYSGEIAIDAYGRNIPYHARGTANLPFRTASAKVMTKYILQLFDDIIDKNLLVRKVSISALNLIYKHDYLNGNHKEQLKMFDDNLDIIDQIDIRKDLKKEEKLQNTIIDIKEKFGKNSILKGLNFEEGATTIERNEQIGGHRA